MKTRRRIDRRRRGKTVAELPNGKAEASAEFFPSGFELAVPVQPAPGSEHLVTYFLLTDKKGLEPYVLHAARYHHDGYRATVVGPPTFSFDKPIVRLVGRLVGDHFATGVEWARSNPIKELHGKYLIAGGGTARERERTLQKYLRAREALVAHDEKRKALEAAIDEAAVALVERFGKGPLEIDGATHDPSYVRDKVYWKKRTGL